MKYKKDVLIIGAGPYAIALAFELKRQNVDFCCVGKLFDLWLNHSIPGSMLRSNTQVSEIYTADNRFTWENYYAENNIPKSEQFKQTDRVNADVFRQYLNWVSQNINFDFISSHVDLLSKHQSGFSAVLNNGDEIVTKKVVNATGLHCFPFIPAALAKVNSNSIMHSFNTNEWSGLESKNILVVGGGQSAAEAIIHLSNKNNVIWLYRNKLVFYHEPLNIPKCIFKVLHKLCPAFYAMPSMMKEKLARKFISPTIDPIYKQKLYSSNAFEINSDIDHQNLKLSDGKFHISDYDHPLDAIIACTGFDYNVKCLDHIVPELREGIANDNGVIKLSWRYMSSIRNLYFLGGISEPSHGPSMRYIMGVKPSVNIITKGILNG